jgi:hypothetical protein
MSFEFKRDEFLDALIDVYLRMADMCHHYYRHRKNTNNSFDKASDYYYRSARELQFRIQDGCFMSEEDRKLTLDEIDTACEMLVCIDIEESGELLSSASYMADRVLKASIVK